MELKKGQPNTVKFTLPVGASQVVVELIYNGTQVGNVLTPSIDSNGLCNLSLPYAAVANEGTLTIKIGFAESLDYNEKLIEYDIVTPYLESWQLAELLPNHTVSQRWDAESAVRNIINAHCGQSFGYYYETKILSGNDSNMLELPDRLDSLVQTNGFVANPSLYRLSGDGRMLTFGLSWIPNTKADYDGLHMGVNSVIYNPYGVTYKDFVFRSRFSLTGWWGWRTVPTPVVEAAKLLLNDYSCDDSAYRDRYLNSITSADWKIAFNAAAYVNTGNVRADQLLADYVLPRGWAAL